MKKIRKALIFVSVYFIIIFASSEVCIRIFYPQPISYFFPYSSEQWLNGTKDEPSKWGIVPSKTLGFKIKPDMFDKTRNELKDKNTFRLIVLGDSVTIDACPPPAYSLLLENFLNKGVNKTFFEVWNLGVPTYNTAQEKELFKERGLSLKPDMVILGFCLNDFTPGMLAMKKNGKVVLYQATDDIWLRINPFLFSKSSLYRLIVSRLMQYKTETVAKKNIGLYEKAKEYKHLSERYYNLVYDSLGYIKTVSSQEKIKFLLLIFPLMKNYNQYSLYEKDAYNAILGIVNKLNIDYIDFRQYFEKPGILEKVRYLDRNSDYLHFNNEGHTIVADVLYKYLIDKKLLN